MLVSIESAALPETVLVCPDDEAPEWRAKLEQRGNPGRLWLASEILALHASGATSEEACKIAEARMLLRADRLWVRPAPKVEKVETQGEMAFGA